MSAIQLDHVTHHYATGTALSDVSASFQEKKTTAIIGKSGGGKSTLLQAVNGMVRPTSGEVRLFGGPIDYRALGALRLKIGYVVQGAGLFPHMTVEENIGVPARIASLPLSGVKARMKTLMSLVQLPASYFEKYPHELSGGEQQRVSICRALLLDPPLLLMDEPFASLDPITRFDLYNEIKTLQAQEPRTILLVTHDMREAQHLAHFIAVLHEGTMQQFGTTTEVIQSPANTHVEDLINATLS